MVELEAISDNSVGILHTITEGSAEFLEFLEALKRGVIRVLRGTKKELSEFSDTKKEGFQGVAILMNSPHVVLSRSSRVRASCTYTLTG
jgi:hypothetical protein